MNIYLRSGLIALLTAFSMITLATCDEKEFSAYAQLTSVQEADELIQRARTAFRNADIQLATELADQAEVLYQAAGDTEGFILVTELRGRILTRQRRTAEARELLLNAIETYPNSIYRAKLHNTLGGTYSPISEAEIVLEHLYTALDYSNRLPPGALRVRTAALYQNIGMVLMNSGRAEEAFSHFIDALKYADAENQPLQLASIYSNLGVAYSNNNQLENAVFYLQRSLAIANEMDAPVEIYRASLNLGNILISAGHYEDALRHYDRASEMLEIISPGVPSVIMLHNRGRAYAYLQRYEEAEALLYQSLNLSEAQSVSEGMYYNNLELGKMFAARSLSDQAITYLNRANEISEGLSNIDFRIDALHELHRAYAGSGNYADAYKHLLRFSALSDSVNQERYTRELAIAENHLELIRQREKNVLLEEQQLQKEQQLRTQRFLFAVSLLALLLLVLLIIQLKRNAASKQLITDELKLQKTKLEHVNRSKDKLFAIVSHDLRNALMSTEGILTLLKNNEISVDEFKQLIPEVESAVQQNSMVMTDLLFWAQEQLSGVKVDLVEINTNELIGGVLQSQKVNASKKNISLEVTDHAIPPVLADINALTFVIRNLVSNAIKFTQKGGYVRISAQNQAVRLILRITDNGVGMSDEVKMTLFSDEYRSTKGTANEKGTGFGLMLSKEFTERMNGSLRFESTEGEGSTFFVELPKAG